MMSLPLRTALGTMLGLLAASVWFVPGLSDEASTTIGTGLMLVSTLTFPRQEISPQRTARPRIIWIERDLGERFSMVMFHIVVLGCIAFIAYLLASTVEGSAGDVLAATLLCAGIWVTVRNWKNRNAR